MSDTAVILSTTPTLEGRPIAEYLGLVTGEAVVAAGLNNFFANLQSAIADPRGHLERLFHEARATTLHELQTRAVNLGADAVVGLRLEYEVLGEMHGLLVTATGTAVRLA